MSARAGAAEVVLPGLVFVLMLGCAPPPPTNPPTYRPTASAPALASPTGSAIVFVKHNVGPGMPAWMGLVPGSLEQSGNCLYIVSDLGEKWLALWPPDYNLVQVHPPAVAPIGGPPIQVGQHAEFGGGRIDASVKEEADVLDDLLAGQPRPEECGTTQYWVVTGFELT